MVAGGGALFMDLFYFFSWSLQFFVFPNPTTKPSQPVHYHKNDCRVPYGALLRGKIVSKHVALCLPSD